VTAAQDAVQIRPARVADAAAISELYCDTLGPGYTSPAVVAEELTASPRAAYFVAEAGGTVVGAANAVWIPRQDMLEVGNVGFGYVQEELLRLGGGTQRFGLLENVGVRSPSRGRGIGGALVEVRLRWLEEQGSGFAYSFAWKTPNGSPAEPLLLTAGFRRVRELADFYLEDGLVNGYACPYHGARCRCSAVLLARTLPRT
jgi:GNAT superfamily N-acetyltransferase